MTSPTHLLNYLLLVKAVTKHFGLLSVSMATKKRKVHAECRVFNKKRVEKYFFVEADNHTANCLTCSESIAVLKEYNLRRHYETKHQSKYSKLSDKLRTEKFQSMKRNLQSQRGLFVKKFTENESISRTSYKIVQKIVEQGKPFTDGNYTKECLMEAVNNLRPKNSNLLAGISVSTISVVRRTEELGENIVAQIPQRISCGVFWLWMSLLISQLIIYICDVNLDFETTEQLTSVGSMHGRTGEDLFLEIEKTLQCYSLHWNKLQCVTVEGKTWLD